MHEQGAPASDRVRAVERLDAATALIREGAISDALTLLNQLDDRAARRALGVPDRALLCFGLLECRLARGDLAGAMSLGHALSELLAADGLAAAIAHYASGELASALGDPELALDHFLAVPRGDADPAGPELLPWRSGAALAQLRRGHAREAGELARRHHAVAVANGSPYAVAVALRTLAATVAGNHRIELLREARATLQPVRADRLRAQIETDLAGALVLSQGGDTAEPLALLRAAEAYAGRQELWPLQSRVRRLLDHLGEPAHQIDSEALATLTAAERRVAALAAEGLTNRQIAEQLVVSVKAVEWHLSNIFRKLEIRSRKALTSTLGAGV